MSSYLSNSKHFPCLLCKPWDEVEGLDNCREFSQPLKCLYQAMQIQEKKISIAFINQLSQEKMQLFVVALIKREILNSREVLQA